MYVFRDKELHDEKTCLELQRGHYLKEKKEQEIYITKR